MVKSAEYQKLMRTKNTHS